MLNMGVIVYMYLGESARADERARERKIQKDHAVGVGIIIIGIAPLSACCHEEYVAVCCIVLQSVAAC